MRQLIQEFPNQLNESLAIAENYNLTFPNEIRNVVICGLGGSGIGGEIIKQWQESEFNAPIAVCHNYVLPKYVNANTLIITCSYSGNTEETLAALEGALKKDAMIIGITSGGKLAKKLKAHNLQTIIIPGGLPPRSALAYPLVQLANIFDQIQNPELSIKTRIARSAELLKSHQSEIINLAESILAKAADKKIMFYAEDQFKPTLIRACQQLNENGKTLGFYNVIPEMNHNEIVGWAKDPKDIFALFSRSSLEHVQNAQRLNLTTKIVQSKTDSVYSITAMGNNLIEQSLFLIHLFDWLSLLVAEKKGIDVIEVEVIEQLKADLAQNN